MNAESGNAEESGGPMDMLKSIKLPTLGGMQFWTDLRWWHGWRIQENKVSGHCRVLDASNIRHFFGTRAQCEAAFETTLTQQQWPHPPERVVIFLHGLMRTHRSFHSLGERLQKEQGATPIYFGYASTRSNIQSHADALKGLIEGLPGNPRVDFVGHSLGNIVTRHAIGDWQRAGNPDGILDRVGRFVMQGPPNQGASIARRLKSLDLFEIVTGRSGMELGGDWGQLQEKLATPSCEFGIVAGEVDAGPVKNPLVEGAGDFVVSVEEAKLPGAADFLKVPVLHSFLMDDDNVQVATLRFLDTGAFDESGRKNPLR